MADPSLLKYKSFAAAVIWEERVLRTATLCVLPKELDDMEAKDDNLLEAASFLPLTVLPGAAKEPTDGMAAKADAIIPLQ